MNKRRNNFEAGAGSASSGQPEFKIVNGQQFQKKDVPFGDGFVYVPMSNDVPVDEIDTSPRRARFSDDFAQAIQNQFEAPREVLQEQRVIPSEGTIEKLQRAKRGLEAMHSQIDEKLAEALRVEEEARRAEAEQLAAEQAKRDKDALFELVGATPSVAQTQQSLMAVEANRVQDSSKRGAKYNSTPEVTGIPRKKRFTRKTGAVALASLVVLGSGTAAAMQTTPNGLMSAFINGGQAGGGESKNILPLPSAELIDAFGGCLGDNGAGEPLVEYTVTSQTEVNQNYKSSKDTPKIFETDYVDNEDNVIKEHVKPVIITPVEAKVASCVTEEDKASVLKIEGDSIIVDMSKISPQLFLNGNQAMRGFPVTDVVKDPTKELWPAADIIEGNIEAGKAVPDTVEKMTPEIGKAILDSFNDPANLAAQIRQAHEKTALTLIRPNGGHQEKIKTELRDGILEAIKLEAVSLKEQGLTGITNPKITFVEQMKDLTGKNPEAPKVDSFSLAATTQITNFAIKSAE